MLQRAFVQALVVGVLAVSDALLGADVLEHLFLEAELDVVVVGDWLFVGFVLRAVCWWSLFGSLRSVSC